MLCNQRNSDDEPASIKSPRIVSLLSFHGLSLFSDNSNTSLIPGSFFLLTFLLSQFHSNCSSLNFSYFPPSYFSFHSAYLITQTHRVSGIFNILFSLIFIIMKVVNIFSANLPVRIPKFIMECLCILVKFM